VIWLNPLALIGVAAIVAPIVIHILVQRRARPFPFPTLRFLEPARLAAVRRRALEDLPLLVVRTAILAAAAGALAGPLLVTPARRAAWNNRVARAIVGEGELGGGPERTGPRRPGTPSSDRRAALSGPPAAFQTALETSDLREGIARAMAWLETSPPARRELVVVAPFALGSLTRADLAGVPPDVGVRLVRSEQLPASRSFAAPPVIDADVSSFSVRRRDRTIELAGASTSLREAVPVAASAPIEIVASPEVKRAAGATLTAVLSQRVPAPVPGRSARVAFESSAAALPRSAEPLALRTPQGELAPWIADAIASLTSGGEALSGAAADGNTLVVTTSLPPSDLRTALLFRSIFAAMADDASPNGPSIGRSAKASAERGPRSSAALEVLAIPDADLHAWERPSAAVRSPRFETVERDDRRWWWAAVLALLAIEGWARRSRGDRAEEARSIEAARVA